MLYEVVLFALAILPVVILGWYVYSKDRDREPAGILLKLFGGGLLAAILTVIITFSVKSIFPIFNNFSDKSTGFSLIIYAFIMVSLIEEFSKWLFTYIISYHNKEFDQLYDMIVYSVFVALGFAWIENVLYVMSGGVSVAILRMFLAVPTHVSVGIFMGYYLSIAKLQETHGKSSTKYRILSLVVPFIFHGIYDYTLYSGNSLLLLFCLIFVLFLYSHAYKKLKALSLMRTNLIIKYCPNCGANAEEMSYCSRCGNKLK